MFHDTHTYIFEKLKLISNFASTTFVASLSFPGLQRLRKMRKKKERKNAEEGRLKRKMGEAGNVSKRGR